MLPRVSRTFALNTRLLNGTLGESVRVGYLLCRTADTLEDAWPGPADEIGDRFDRFVAALAGDPSAREALARAAAARGSERPEFDLLAHVDVVLRALGTLPPSHQAAVREGVETLARGMRRYAVRGAARSADLPYLDTAEELDDYCWIVAGCVGVMLTRLVAAEYGAGDPAVHERRLALAPQVGKALQLTNILLDWPTDIRLGRCYVPGEWLSAEGLAPRDLVERGRPAVLALARRLEAEARRALAAVPDYIDLIPVRWTRYRLFCLWPALWALGSLRHARRDPEFPWGPRRPRLPRAQIWSSALSGLLAVHDGRALRQLYARSAGEAWVSG
jgi:farnesyl-diphosphate farnesyltransferase